jgi:protein N-terminal amidase
MTAIIITMLIWKSPGYNFQSLEEITPYLEPSCAGPSTQWAISTARKYGIHVTVGYPETVPHPLDQQRQSDGTSVSSEAGPKTQANYNSTVTVSPTGAVVATYRKRFLYYTDETWALEGNSRTSSTGFFTGDLGALGKVSMGICMDINPYKFLSPWASYEFANHVLAARTPLVVLSMAWLTRLSEQALAEQPTQPDDETFVYWIERFSPLRDVGDDAAPTVVVCANRCGSEGSACYAGTSSVFAFGRGKVEIFDVCGKGEERCMVVDLMGRPKFALQRGAS